MNTEDLKQFSGFDAAKMIHEQSEMLFYAQDKLVEAEKRLYEEKKKMAEQEKAISRMEKEFSDVVEAFQYAMNMFKYVCGKHQEPIPYEEMESAIGKTPDSFRDVRNRYELDYPMQAAK